MWVESALQSLRWESDAAAYEGQHVCVMESDRCSGQWLQQLLLHTLSTSPSSSSSSSSSSFSSCVFLCLSESPLHHQHVARKMTGRAVDAQHTWLEPSHAVLPGDVAGLLRWLATQLDTKKGKKTEETATTTTTTSLASFASSASMSASFVWSASEQQHLMSLLQGKAVFVDSLLWAQCAGVHAVLELVRALRSAVGARGVLVTRCAADACLPAPAWIRTECDRVVQLRALQSSEWTGAASLVDCNAEQLSDKNAKSAYVDILFAVNADGTVKTKTQ